MSRILVALFFMCTLAAQAAYAAPVRLTILSGPIGGEWYALGGAIGEVIKKSIPGSQVTVSTGSGVPNILQLQANTGELGLSQSMLLAAALKGEAPYEGRKVTDVVGLAYIQYLYQSYFLVKENVKLNSIEQMIKEKYPIRLALGVTGTTPELASRRLLAEYGVTYKDIESWGGKLHFVSFAEVETLMADGHIEAYTGPVLGAITQVISLNKMRLLPWSEEALDAMVSKYSYLKKTLPKGRYYFVEDDIPFLAEANIVAIRKSVPDNVAYAIAKGLAENADMIRESGATYRNFNPAEMASDVGGPIHPGAARYYKERGWMQ